MKGFALSIQGNYDEAVKYYDKALAMDPNDEVDPSNEDILDLKHQLSELGSNNGNTADVNDRSGLGNSENSSAKGSGNDLDSNHVRGTGHTYNIESLGVQITFPSDWQVPTQCEVSPIVNEIVDEDFSCVEIDTKGGHLDIVRFEDNEKLGERTENLESDLKLINGKVISGPSRIDIDGSLTAEGQQYPSSTLVYTTLDRDGQENLFMELAKPDSDRTWLVVQFSANVDQYVYSVLDLMTAISTITPISSTDNSNDED